MHINQDKALRLSFDEVIQRWHRLFKGTLYSQQYVKDEAPNKNEKQVLNSSVNR